MADNLQKRLNNHFACKVVKLRMAFPCFALNWYGSEGTFFLFAIAKLPSESKNGITLSCVLSMPT